MKTIFSKLPLCIVFFCTPQAFGEQIITIESTISGSQEQPKMLVIIPWQKPQETAALTDSNAGNEKHNHPFLQPIERQSFVEKNAWLQQIHLQKTAVITPK